MKYADVVARRQGFKWVQARRVRPGDVQRLAGRWLNVVAVLDKGSDVWFTYDDGEQRRFPAKSEVGIRPGERRLP